MHQRLLILLTFAAVAIAHGGIDHDTEGPGEQSHGVMAQGNVGLGFGLTALAGGCSAIGSALPFLDVLLPWLFPSLFAGFVITKSKSFIATLLSFSAGILIFLALGDLYGEAVSNWSAANFLDKSHGGVIVWAIMTVTFGILFMVRKIRGTKHSHDLPSYNEGSGAARADDPKNDPAVMHVHDEKIDLEKPEQTERFRTLGVQVAIALAIHNFPEGLATFSLALTSPRIGVVFAIALAMHKIPEGMIIALPIYAATKSRMKAFLFAAIMATVTQIAGALMGYLLFVTYWNQAVSGTLFAITIAILVWVVLGGMLPMARSLDEEDKWVLPGVVAGVLFFGIVNALFAYAA